MAARILGLALIALLAASASAQGRLAFDAPTAGLGRIAEAAGPVTHTFRFTNAGDAPLRLVAVEASCGCTTPSWSEGPIAPGARGTVEVAYDPAGRPGDFDKAVFVQAEGADPAAVTLRIEGVVRPVLADTGVRMGALAFETAVKDLGEVPAEGGVQTSIQYANVGERPVRVDSVSSPPGVDVAFSTRPIFPDRLGGLFVTAPQLPVGRQTVGHGVEVDLVLYTDDPVEPVKTVRVRATLGLTVEEVGTIDAAGGR